MNEKELTKKDVALFVEGFLYGLIEEKYDDLDTCISEIESVGLDIKQAIEDLNTETFKGVKKGLAELA